MEIKDKKASVWDKCEILINTANHGLIAITTFYLVWYCLQNYVMTSTLTQHAWVTAIGYQVLMAEGIMTIYKANSLTFLSSKREKNHIHWILQVIGGTMALYGCIIEIIDKERAGRRHFRSLHAIYGKSRKEKLLFLIEPHLCVYMDNVDVGLHILFFCAFLFSEIFLWTLYFYVDFRSGF